MKHHQVAKVPRGSSALGWQSRRAALPAPCALQDHGLSKRSLPSLVDRWKRAWGGQEGAPGLWNCSGQSGHIEAAGPQAGNGTMGDTLTFEEPLPWKEAVMLQSPSQGSSVDPMQVRSPDLTQI